MINVFSNTGAYHSASNAENQDAVCHAKNKRYTVISLADGVSSCDKAKTGAEIASKAITNLFLKKGSSFFEFNDRQVSELVLSHILYELKQQARKDTKETEEYSSTISSVLFDKNKQQLLYFNLGDSIIVAAGGGKCRILAMPSDSLSGCCVTTTENAHVKAVTKVIKIAGTESVMICSDGAWRQMFDKNKLKPEVYSMISNHEFRILKEYLGRQEIFDDYSFISMDLQQTKRRKPA